MEIERVRDAVSYSGSAVKSGVTETAPAEPVSAETETAVNTSFGQQGQAGTTDNDAETAEQGPLVGNNTQIKKAVEEINKKARNSEAIFGIHDATNRVTIKIVDKDSKEVIKEYPPEKTLDMIAKVWEVAGLLVDEKL